MAVAIPLIGALAQGMGQKNADDANARTYAEEGTLAAAQGYSAEANQRRVGSMAIGHEIAAAGQAGGGYGGSVGRSISQSAQNAEMDDLNVRYKAGMQKWSYLTQSGNLRQEGNDAMATSTFRAGAALLKGSSASYLGTDLG